MTSTTVIQPSHARLSDANEVGLHGQHDNNSDSNIRIAYPTMDHVSANLGLRRSVERSKEGIGSYALNTGRTQ